MTMDIETRIKELQKDPKYSFKQTKEIIDIIYRIAVNDYDNSINNLIDNVHINVLDKNNANKNIESDFDELNKKNEIIKQQKEKINELLHKIDELKKSNKILKQEKEKNSEQQHTSDSIQYISGYDTGLKFALSTIENYIDRNEAWSIILNEYNKQCIKNRKI